jgi:hypothetical protein
MPTVLHTWIYTDRNAYDEFAFVPWLNKTVYRGAVDLSHVKPTRAFGHPLAKHRKRTRRRVPAPRLHRLEGKRLIRGRAAPDIETAETTGRSVGQKWSNYVN